MSFFQFFSNYKYMYNENDNTSCLYNVLDNTRHLYDDASTKYINILLNQSWESIKDCSVIDFANEIIGEGKAMIYSQKIYREDYCEVSDLVFYGLLEPIPFIDSLHIQMSNLSDEKEFDEMFINSCYTDRAWGRKGKIRDRFAEEIVRFFNGMYIQNVYFYGKLTENDREKITYIMEYLKPHNTDVCYSYITDISVDIDMLNLCKEYEMVLFVTLYEHQVIEKKEFKKIYNKLKTLNASGIITKINFVAESGKYMLGVKKIQTYGFVVAKISESAKHSGFHIVPDFEKRKKSELILYNREYIQNNCLYRRIAIDCCGNIYPCPAINYLIGNIYQNEKKEIFSQKSIYNWWNKTKKKTNTCGKCAYLYGCFDCKVTEMICENDTMVAKKICKNMNN